MKNQNTTISNIETPLKPYINHVLKFLQSHKIKHLDLQTSFQTSMTILPTPIKNSLKTVKLISIFVYTNFNNIQLDCFDFNKYCSELNF
jgi:hypothetical protein